MITENLSTLKINKLTQEQYDRELAAGRIDENALYLTPESFSGSWDDLTDKPFYEETTTVVGDTLTWDGNTEGLVSDDIGMFYKVSDIVLTDEQIKLGFMATSTGQTSPAIGTGWDSGVAAGYITEDVVVAEVISFVRKPNVSIKGITFPETGIYFMAMQQEEGGIYVKSFTIPGYTGFKTTTTTLKPIDTKYLPEHLQFGEEKAFEPIVWDGNTEGLESYADAVPYVYYNIGDYVALFDPRNAVHSITVKTVMHDGTETEQTVVVPNDGTGFNEGTNPGHGYSIGDSMLIFSDGEFALSNTQIVPKGIWLAYIQNGNVCTIFVSAVNPASTVKPLDEKYIPDTIARVSDIPTVEDFINALPIYNGEVEEV